MNVLDDDDPANDTTGLEILAVSLFHAGYREDAAAMLAILFKPLEDIKAMEKEQAEERVSSEPGEYQVDASAPIEELQGSSESIWEDVQSEAEATPTGQTEVHVEGFIGPPENPMLSVPMRPKPAGRGLSLNIEKGS